MPVFTISQQVLSPCHAMGCNPVSMVDPLGLRAGMFPETHGAGGPTQMDIALMTPPTILLDRIYGFGNDPWTMMNRGALNDLAKQILEAEAIEGERIQKSYRHYVYLESKRRLGIRIGNYVVGNDAEEYAGAIIDHSTLGTDRVTYQYGSLKISFSKRGGGLATEYLEDEYLRRGIWVFAVYEGDLSAYDKTDWVQSVFSTSGVNGSPSNEWFNDYNKDTKNGGKHINQPFYYNKSKSTKAWRRDMDAKFGGRVFHDGPNRMSYSSLNLSWTAQLSLVGLRNGTWETIQTVRYGFSVSGSTVTYSPMLLNHISNATPNYFHQSLINLLNSYRKK